MPASRRDDKYSSVVGAIFLFNLIVGTGALALPCALQNAGWVVGVALLLILGLFSYITVTFIVESLAVANAVSRKRYGESSNTTEEVRQRLIQNPDPDAGESYVYDITEKYELGQMAVLLSPKWCQIIIYGSLCLYLFGDLSIYAVVFGRTWANVLCNTQSSNKTGVAVENAPCWQDSNITEINVYRLSILAFVILLGPFVFFNLQKTKILQIFTGVMRWVAFLIMIVWCIVKLSREGRKGYPVIAEITALPTLFGTLVYSFMTQHSIPGLVYPIRHKNHIRYILPIDFTVITIFYLLLALTAIFTYPKLNEVYTLTFWDESEGPEIHLFQKILAYYLALYPVFTLGTNFPLLAITLRNNFRAMILRDSQPKWYFDQFLFPLIVLLLPILLALAVSDLHLLVGIIGSYCGTCVQYLIPCILVTFARQHARSIDIQNKFSSPFKSKFWIYAVYVWMILSLIFITINLAKLLV
ncbi:hypothetical protein RUM44_004819 [Polyplax serrata]|uniref:Amino acid transporter transmembrane domain-containing protein n=1 Tax=Polyplax serrata TaxID=468196 RepID=A0ABR1B3W7_POLSC